MLTFSASLCTDLIDVRRTLSIQNKVSAIGKNVNYWQYDVDDKFRNNDNSHNDSQVLVFRHLHGVKYGISIVYSVKSSRKAALSYTQPSCFQKRTILPVCICITGFGLRIQLLKSVKFRHKFTYITCFVYENQLFRARHTQFQLIG